MLINFKVANFLSIFEEQELSLYPNGRLRKKNNHIYKTEKKKHTDVLKSSVLYGANSSGKTNLIKAILFAKDFIVNGSKSKKLINITNFKLLKNNTNPSKFQFEIYINNNCYEYGFEIKDNVIKSEWLKSVTKYSENYYFIRNFINGKNNIEYKNKINNDDMKLVRKSCMLEVRDNQLLLTVLNDKNPNTIEKHYREVYRWFDKILMVITPQSKFHGIQIEIKKDEKLYAFFNQYLNILDTGIDKLAFHKYKLDDSKLNIPAFIKNDIKNKLQEKTEIVAISNNNNEYYCIYLNESGEYIAGKLKAKHKRIDSKSFVELDFNEESAGTHRIFELLPILYTAINTEKVILVDELGRSFNSLVSAKFFELFFEMTENKPSQLIATTHDLILLDLNKFRRDEIWFIKKDIKNQSILYSLEEFLTRFDKKLRKAYLEGRYGAIPILDNISGGQ
ncbi:MAG: ATP-binding protein [Candidatus Cloacimonadota bacterium]|nr:ATP-binding protein [Candidatus Cloacimonadota bacterium]